MVAPGVASAIVTDCAAVNVPLAGVIAGVAALCGGGGLTDCEEPVLPQPIPENTRAVTNNTAVTPASHRGGASVWPRERSVKANKSRVARNASEKPGCGRRLPKGCRGGPGNTAACEGDNVETETVKGTAAPFVTVRLAGTVHCAPKGAPEQVRLIVPEKLGPGTIWRL